MSKTENNGNVIKAIPTLQPDGSIRGIKVGDGGAVKGSYIPPKQVLPPPPPPPPPKKSK
jgi:hypothetical protein